MACVRKYLHVGVRYSASQIWKRAWFALTDPYRPEQHYMRGLGPKCRAQGMVRPAKPSNSAAANSVKSMGG
jgi:hypothetical protein